MVKLENVTEGVLDVINDNKFSQTGAFNLRENGTSICHGDSEHIKIKKKTDKPGIDIYIDGKTDGEAVYIPVVLSKSGMTDLVYNDFYVEDGADVRIVAGCGIHNRKEEYDPEFDTNSVKTAKSLHNEYKRIAYEKNTNIISAADYVQPSETDQEHLTAQGHEILANAIFNAVVSASIV